MSDLDQSSPTSTRVPDALGGELRKPHEMIVMLPRSARVTLIGRKVYNAMIHFAQARLAMLDGMPSADFVFEAPLAAILRATGSNGDDRTVAKKYIKEMRGLEVDWESTAQGDGVKWRGFSMLAEASIEVRRGENWVTWAYPPTIMSALRDPSRWARLDLSVMAKLGTYAAVALYEICARYRDNPSGVTSRKPVAWWADALSHTPAGTERREWRKFKSERVRAAIDEINRETDLQIELIEFKAGRVVVDAQFSVRRKRISRPATSGPVDAALALRAEALGVRESRLDDLIGEFGEQAVRTQLDVLERRSGGQAISRFAELRGLLRGEIGSRALDQVPQRPLVFHASDPRPDDQRVREHRIAEVRAEVQTLDDSTRRAYAQRALDLLAHRGQANALVRRRFEQGDYLHGLLGATVVQVYAVEKHGQDWDK